MLLCIFIVTKPQQATDISADNLSTAERLSKKQGKMSNIENNVSSKDIISQHARKGFKYFITFPLIFISRDSDQTNI